MDSTLLYSKLASLRDSMKAEVSDFIDFLINKSKKEDNLKPKFGSGNGMFKMSADFDAPLEDFKEYMY